MLHHVRNILTWICFCVTLLAGCSTDRLPTYPAHGRVAFPDGEPVRTGVIELSSLDHSLNARGQIGRDGTFRLGTYESYDGAVAGVHRAIVVQFISSDSGPEVDHDHGDSIDRVFADYGTSGLQFTIRPDMVNELHVVVRRGTDSR